jgi:hypothetical protein
MNECIMISGQVRRGEIQEQEETMIVIMIRAREATINFYR